VLPTRCVRMVTISSSGLFSGYNAYWAICAACVLRIGLVSFLWTPNVSGIEEGYLDSAAALASGRGLVMWAGNRAGDSMSTSTISSAQMMRRRQSEGGRIDSQHPFPPDLRGWIPSTLHPPGYSLLAAALYSAGNYTFMLIGLRALAIGAETVACALVIWLGVQLFDRRTGLAAGWVYALLPSAAFNVTYLLPDSFHGFFSALTLCLAHRVVPSRRWAPLFAGAFLGLAAYFRSEYLSLIVPLFLLIYIRTPRLAWCAGRIAGVLATALIVLSPWAMWTYCRTGRVYFSGTGAGAVMYMAIGEDAANPWKIKPRDQWITNDACERGFRGPWSAEADAYYAGKTREYVKAYPMRYVKTAIIHRLPMALVPPYLAFGARRTSDAEFSFGSLRAEQGLSRWQVIAKYPRKTIEHYWVEVLTAGISAVLLCALLGLSGVQWRQWRRNAWLFLPWAHMVTTICLLKSVEPRNLAPVLVVQAIALGAVIAGVINRRVERQGARLDCGG
jgi:4-amino-4-deoxy-L-arabinose transferase-like glycosyltransferase